jgi:hypothetical protein
MQEKVKTKEKPIKIPMPSSQLSVSVAMKKLFASHTYAAKLHRE